MYKEDITIIISDVHLGSDNCQAKLLDEFLQDIDERCGKLIINGDLFDSMDFNRLKKSHWKILSDLRKLSDKIQIVWVEGNHDIGISEIMSHLLGIPVVQQYKFVSGEKNIVVAHGHIFDRFIDDYPIITQFADFIYRWLLYIDKSHNFARWAKHQSKHYLHCLEIMEQKAIELKQQLNCDIVCLGHSHFAVEDKINGYYNSGCWTENNKCTYIQIKNGAASVIPFGPC